MSEGFTIPLEGDATPFREAVGDLRKMMSSLSSQMSGQTRNARGDVKGLGRSWNSVGKEARSALSKPLRSLKKIGSMAGRAGRALRGMFRGVGKALPIAGLIGGVGGLGAAFAAFKGLKSAIDFGGELSDLSARTGIAVRDLALLQQAFQDNGVAGDRVADVVNRMQKSLSDAGAGLKEPLRGFELLGLTVSELLNMDPAKQFAAIQQQIAGLSDPSERVAAAWAIFGASGKELITLFEDGKAMDRASVTLGKQADLLARNAQRFDRVSDLLGNAGVKLRGFFVGVADRFAGPLLGVLEELNKIDLTQFGRAVGQVGLTFAAAVKEGRVFELVQRGLSVAVQTALELLHRGLQGQIAFLSKTLPQVFGLAMAKLKDPQFWQGVIQLFHGAAKLIQGELLRIIPGKGSEGRVASIEGESLLAAARFNMSRAGDGKPLDEELFRILKEGWAAYVREFTGAARPEAEKARKEWAKMWRSLQNTADELADPAKAPSSRKQLGAALRAAFVPSGFLSGADSNSSSSAPSPAAPSLARFVSSMARIGGGGGVATAMAPVLLESRKQTRLQGTMVNHLKELNVKWSRQAAVYQ